MQYKAIIFDLYGTLVPIFSRKIYDPVLVNMAKILNVPYQTLLLVCNQFSYTQTYQMPMTHIDQMWKTGTVPLSMKSQNSATLSPI